MHEEKLEHGDAHVDEEMAGYVSENLHLTRQILWKMDVRSVKYTLLQNCSSLKIDRFQANPYPCAPVSLLIH